MKLFIYADPHWSSYSSIVRSRGEKYSTRLENLIQTMNWIENEAQRSNCDAIVCLGDFFDKSELNSEEITALQEVSWNSSIRHYMIVGNHEMGRSNLEHSSSHLFALIPNVEVIDSPYAFNTNDNTSIIFLPYILETDRQPLKEYTQYVSTNDKVIILSHNDIAGIQMGQFISTSGFSIDEIEDNCTLFINGHLHNGTDIGNKIINLGNITGQNFSEDAQRYKHNALILDTETKTISKVENPFAMKFYKLDLTTYRDNDKDCKAIQNIIDKLGTNAVVTAKVLPENDFILKDLLDNSPNILDSRVLIELVKDEFIEVDNSINYGADHISQFIAYIKTELGNSEDILDELDKITGIT